MRYWAFLLIMGAALSVLFTPVSIRAAARMGALDVPDGMRHRHARPTPRLGGLALFCAILLLSLLFLPDDSTRAVWLTGGALIAALGVSDDLFRLSPRVKLLTEAAIATLPLAFGLAPRVFTLGSITFSPPDTVNKLLTLLWVLALCNAFNLIDGLDALAVSLGSVGSIALALMNGNATPLLLLGALFGFLPYNRRALTLLPRKSTLPTRTFLGDTGALFIGYSLAVLSLSPDSSFSLFTPLFFAVPLFDLIFATVRRLLQGKSPFVADRSHLHHRLGDAGLSPSSVLFVLTLSSVAAASLALLLFRYFA